MNRTPSKVTVDTSKLKDLRKALKGMGSVKVGVLSSGSAAVAVFDDEGHYTGMSMAELVALHEFGSADGKIPPRSSIRMPLETKGAKLYEFIKSPKVKKMLAEGETEKVLALLGVAAEGAIQEAFESGGFGGWAPNAPATVARKGSASPLIDTGEMRKSYSSEVVS